MFQQKKKNLIITLLILTINITNQFITEELISEFMCIPSEKALSIDLKKNPLIKNNEFSFSISFWSKYQLTSNFPLFTIDSLSTNIVFGIDANQNLMINTKKTLLGPLKPSLDIYDNDFFSDWNFFVLFLKRNLEEDSYDLNILVNNLKLEKKFSFKTDNEFLFLILGSDKFYGDCKVLAQFQHVSIYDNKETFQIEDVQNLAAEKAKIIFLSKFNKEPSYNKFYENLLNNGIGGIRNGIRNNSFNFFTSLSNANNNKKIKQHLIHDLSLFVLPEFLEERDINQSYVFVSQFDFFYKDFKKSNFQNQYSHVLYQRLSKTGVEILIRSEIFVKMGQIDNEITLRNYINEKIVSETPIQLEMNKSGDLKKIDFQYLIIKVTQNPLNNFPVITFENGITKKTEQFNYFVKLSPSDIHLFGDNQKRDSTRKEYFSFVNIKEILITRGGYIRKNEEQGLVSYFSGFNDKVDEVLLCKNLNNVERGKKGNVNLLSCEEEQNEVLCDVENCDICNGSVCEICDIGFEIVENDDESNGCRKCEENEGYDIVFRKCFTGEIISEFFFTQFGNLIAASTDVIINPNELLLITFKFKIDPETFLNSAFYLFINNVDSHNRLMDICFENCEDKIHEIHFSLAEVQEIFQLENLIFGNSGTYALKPISLIYKIKTKDEIELQKKFKNFDCKILNPNLIFNLESKNYGTCQRSCSTSQFFHKRTNTCLTCPSNCLTCKNNTECLTCKKNEILINSKCEKCQEPCIRCIKTVNTCLSCSSEDLFDSKNNNCLKKCEKKKKNCETCNYKNGNCAKCEFGYILKNNECFLNLCKVKNCQICESVYTCKKCKMGFIEEKGFCEICKRNCKICPVGYTLNFRKSCVLTKNSDEGKGKDILPFVPDIVDVGKGEVDEVEGIYRILSFLIFGLLVFF